MSKIFPEDTLVDEAVKTAEKIAEQAPIAVLMAKEAVNVGNIFCKSFARDYPNAFRFIKNINFVYQLLAA